MPSGYHIGKQLCSLENRLRDLVKIPERKKPKNPGETTDPLTHMLNLF